MAEDPPRPPDDANASGEDIDPFDAAFGGGESTDNPVGPPNASFAGTPEDDLDSDPEADSILQHDEGPLVLPGDEDDDGNGDSDGDSNDEDELEDEAAAAARTEEEEVARAMARARAERNRLKKLAAAEEAKTKTGAPKAPKHRDEPEPEPERARANRLSDFEPEPDFSEFSERKYFKRKGFGDSDGHGGGDGTIQVATLIRYGVIALMVAVFGGLSFFTWSLWQENRKQSHKGLQGMLAEAQEARKQAEEQAQKRARRPPVDDSYDENNEDENDQMERPEPPSQQLQDLGENMSGDVQRALLRDLKQINSNLRVLRIKRQQIEESIDEVESLLRTALRGEKSGSRGRNRTRSKSSGRKRNRR